MSIEKKIIQYIHDLPEGKKEVVLDFVKRLQLNNQELEWIDFSLSSALQGMENEETWYSTSDLKESFL